MLDRVASERPGSLFAMNDSPPVASVVSARAKERRILHWFMYQSTTLARRTQAGLGQSMNDENTYCWACLQLYASQTKILKDRTKDRSCIFDAIFKTSSPKSSTHTLEKYVEITRPIFCSLFQNLRLGSINFVSCKPTLAPQTKIGKTEQNVA